MEVASSGSTGCEGSGVGCAEAAPAPAARRSAAEATMAADEAARRRAWRGGVVVVSVCD